MEKNMASSYEEIMKTKPYLPLNMGGRLTEAMIAKAKDELGETEEVKAKAIPELRQLIQAEHGLTCPTDDLYMLQYLRARKFNVRKAFQLLKNYNLIKKSNADLYGSFDEEVTLRGLRLKAGFLLPYRDQDGCAVGVINMRKWNTDVTNAPEAIIILTMAVLIAAQEPATQICGLRVLVDMRGTKVKQIRSLIPRYVLLLAKAFTNCIPIRFKGFHLYNESPMFQYMISFLKLFLTEKIKNRFHLHGDNQKHLHKFIPKAILPAECYGGDNTSDIADWFNAEVEKYFEMFNRLTTYGYSQ